MVNGYCVAEIFDLYGFPIQFESRLILGLLDRMPRALTRARPALTVRLVESLDGFQKAGYRKRGRPLLLGDGFALDYERRALHVAMTGERHVTPTRSAPHNLLARTVLFALAMLAESGGARAVARRSSRGQAPLHLHASAVAGPRGALVFCGKSTFGKSTISGKLLADYAQVEDDQAIVLVGKGQPRLALFGKPESRRAPWTLPVAGLFWLKKAREFRIETMDQAEAASLLLSPLLDWKDAAIVSNRLRMLRALLTAMPCRRLSFRKEAGRLVEMLKEQGYL